MSNCLKCSIYRTNRMFNQTIIRHNIVTLNQNIIKHSTKQSICRNFSSQSPPTHATIHVIKRPHERTNNQESNNQTNDQSNNQESITQTKEQIAEQQKHHRSLVLSTYRQLLTYDRHQPSKQRQREQIRNEFRANRDLPFIQSNNQSNNQPNDQSNNQSNSQLADAVSKAEAKLRFLRMRTPARLWRKDCYTDPKRSSLLTRDISFVYDQFGDIIMPLTEEEQKKLRKLNVGTRVVNSQGITDVHHRQNAELLKRFSFQGPMWAHKNVKAPPIVPLGPAPKRPPVTHTGARTVGRK